MFGRAGLQAFVCHLQCGSASFRIGEGTAKLLLGVLMFSDLVAQGLVVFRRLFICSCDRLARSAADC